MTEHMDLSASLDSAPTSPPTTSEPVHEDRAWRSPQGLALTLGAMLVLLAWSATHTDLPQFRGKAMTGRLVCFPLAAAVVPVGWLMPAAGAPVRSRSRTPRRSW